MQLVPMRVQEGSVQLRDDSKQFALEDGDGSSGLSFSFVEIPPDWAEMVPFIQGLLITCQTAQREVAVRMEAWTEEPAGHEEQGNERCELLINWTSGEVSLRGDFEWMPDLYFPFGPSALSTDYRLRISRRWQPSKNETTQRTPPEDQHIPSPQESYLFQFWPVPPAYDELTSKEESELEPTDLLSSREKAIITSIGRGMSDREISNALQISLRAFHLSQISLYRKLGVENQDRTAAVVSALRRGLIKLE